MNSKNIVFTGQDQVEVLNEAVAAPGPGQILIKTEVSLISTGTEGIVLARKFAPGTHWDNWVKYPFYPGYNNAGRIVEVGSGVAGWKVGDRVATRSNHRALILLGDGAKQSDRIPEGVKADTSSWQVYPIPDGVSDESAAWFGMANIVQVGVRGAKHALGDSVVIVGAGILGQLLVQYVRLMGAREIIVIDTAAPRLAMAKTHGATVVLEMGVENAKEAVYDLTGGAGADVVYDVTGHPRVFQAALGLARRFGTLLLLGDAGTPSEQRLTSDVITRGVRIVGVHDGHIPGNETPDNRWTQKHQTELFFEFLRRGQMCVDDLITHRYAPDEAPAAYHMLQTDRTAAMGVVFEWGRAKA